MPSTIRTMLLAAMLAMSSGVASAGPLEDADAAYKRGDYATAISLLRPLADQGDAKAQAALGNAYSTGDGVAKNDTEAVKWYRLAAEQGFAPAQTNLGYMYSNGTGVPKNDTEAVEWFRKAADQGEAGAQYFLGNMYDKGQGVPENAVQAYKWFNIAAAQGNAMAKASKAIIEKKMTSEQIAEAQKLSAEWKPTKQP